MAVDGITGSSSTNTNINVVEAGDTGFAGLTSESFLKLLITELQNQDPTEPVGNEELLNQLSMMRNLESNIELADTLKAITGDQQLSTAANYIGKTVTGQAISDDVVTGVVEKAFLSDGKAYVTVDGQDVELAKILTVQAAA